MLQFSRPRDACLFQNPRTINCSFWLRSLRDLDLAKGGQSDHATVFGEESLIRDIQLAGTGLCQRKVLWMCRFRQCCFQSDPDGAHFSAKEQNVCIPVPLAKNFVRASWSRPLALQCHKSWRKKLHTSTTFLLLSRRSHKQDERGPYPGMGTPPRA